MEWLEVENSLRGWEPPPPREFRYILPERLATQSTRRTRLECFRVPGLHAFGLDQKLTFAVHCMVELHSPVLLKVPAWGTFHIFQGFHGLSGLYGC